MGAVGPAGDSSELASEEDTPNEQLTPILIGASGDASAIFDQVCKYNLPIFIVC